MNGDLNWGADSRLFPKFVGWLQTRTQITFLPHVEPFSVTLAIFPPLLVVNFPLFWREAQKWWFADTPLKPSLHLRLGWRRDMNSGEYYLSAAAKVVSRALFW